MSVVSMAHCGHSRAASASARDAGIQAACAEVRVLNASTMGSHFSRSGGFRPASALSRASGATVSLSSSNGWRSSNRSVLKPRDRLLTKSPLIVVAGLQSRADSVDDADAVSRCSV